MLIIRADGNARIGAGHMMRCLTIADAARSGGEEDILFLCADAESAEMARENGFRAEALGTDYQDMEVELEGRVKTVQAAAGQAGAAELEGRAKTVHAAETEGGNSKNCWEKWVKTADNTILVDSYYVTELYLEGLKKYGRVFLMDDLQRKAYPVDAVINYNVFASEEIYKKLYVGVQANQQAGRVVEFYLGGQYVPLRPQFRNVEYEVRDRVQNVLITTGGGDVDNIAGKILDCLQAGTVGGAQGGVRSLDFLSSVTFHVLVGRFSPHFQSWEKRAGQSGDIRLYHDIRDMAGLMRECDLAVTAGGSTVYELAAVGVPFICFSYAENQEALVEYIGEKEIAGCAGAWHRDSKACMEKLKEIFQMLFLDRETRKAFCERERCMVDGEGADRIGRILCV